MEEFQKVMIEAVMAGSKVARDFFEKAERGEIDENLKEDGTYATEADIAAEKSIIEVINKHYPEHEIMGEELGVEAGGAPYRWIIDPIDGTRYFRRGIPDLFSTEIALARGNEGDGEVIIAASINPLDGKGLIVDKENGVKLINEGIEGGTVRTSGIRDIKEAFLLFGGLNYFNKTGSIDKLVKLASMTQSARGFTEAKGFRDLAMGRVDIIIEANNKSPVDRRARELYIKEAGGVMTTIEGAPLPTAGETNVLAAATPELHEKVVEFFRS